MESIKRHTWDRMAVCPQGQSPMCAWLSLRPTGCTPALSVTQSAAAAAVSGAMEVMGFKQ